MADPIQGTVEKSNGGNTVKETFEVSSEGLNAVRNEIPVGIGGEPFARIPWDKRGEALVNAGTYVKRMGGQERCLRPVLIPLKGGTEGKFHCSMPCMTIGTDGDKLCPDHDKEAFRPNQSHPPRPGRVFNSASVHLSDAEKQVHCEKDGKKYVVEMETGKDMGAARGAASRPIDPAAKGAAQTNIDSDAPRSAPRRRTLRTNTAPRRLSAPRGQSVRIELSIAELKGEDFIETLRDKIVGAINALPAKNVAEMEDVIRVREHVKNELQYQEEGK